MAAGKPYVSTVRTPSGRVLAVAVRQTVEGKTVEHARVAVSRCMSLALAHYVATRRRDEIEADAKRAA